MCITSTYFPSSCYFPVNDPIITISCARVHITAGEEVTIQYLSDTLPTRLRRDLIYRKWYFYCNCLRCSDATEAGTYLDALRCCKCPGSVVPRDPLSRKTDYQCDSCQDITKHEAVMKIYDKATQDAGRNIPRDKAIDHMMRFVEEYKNTLHPQNYIMLSVKMKLGCLLGNMSPSSVLHKMSAEELEVKVDMCLEALNVLDILDQGNVGDTGKWKTRLTREILKVQ